MKSETPYYRQALNEELSRRIEKNPRYSLRAFAGAFDMDSGALSQILSGKRIPAKKACVKLVQGLSLDPESADRFWASVAMAHSQRALKRMNPLMKEILRKGKSSEASDSAGRELSVDLFRAISDWYHLAILELTFVKGFNGSAAWIASQLGLSQREVKLAIERLLSLGLLSRDSKGRLVKSDLFLKTADKSLSTAAHRKRQRQVLEKSIESLENHPIEVRNHSAICMAIDPKKIPAAKERIQRFSRELCTFLEQGERTAVYEVSITLFPHSKVTGPKRSSS